MGNDKKNLYEMKFIKRYRMLDISGILSFLQKLKYMRKKIV
ncbi:hypothetical protein RV02_GL001580 [Enterococcus gilvus]|nr:hypothetical protein RV02_GL001580 [Enterococcus gilvus]